MSATEAVPETGVNAGGSPGTADGSPPEGTASESQTTEGAEVDESSTAEGEREESSRSRETRREPEPDDRDQTIAEYEALMRRIEASPYGEKVLAHLNGSGNGAEPEKSPTEALLDENWPETIVNESGQAVRNPSRGPVEKLLKAMRAEFDAKLKAEIGQKLAGVERHVQTTRFQSALEKRLGSEVVDSPEYQKFARQFEREAPSFRKLREHRPEEAVRWLAAEFEGRARTREQNVAARKRIEDAKGARTNSSSPRGGSSSKTAFKSFDDYIKARSGGYDGIGR